MTSSPQTPADVNGKAHVLLADLANVSLPDDHHHHLGRVLRLRSGDCITATDGRGSWRSAALGTGWPIRAELEWTSEISLAPRRNKLVSVGFALTKGDKPETVVQKLAELGIDRIVLFAAEHSVVRWEPEKASRNIARLQTIAAEALQQSRQAWLSEVSGLVTLSDLSSRGVDEFGPASRADRGGAPLLGAETRFVLIGPEGGWSPAERDRFPEPVGIAPAVLRAETAAIVAGALLVARAEESPGENGDIAKAETTT